MNAKSCSKMDNSTSKTQVIKPLILKAGIPLVLSVAGFIYARIIMSRRNTIPHKPKVCPLLANIDANKQFRDDQETCFHDLESLSSHVKIEDMAIDANVLSSIKSSDISFEDEILGLRSTIEELQKRELDLEMMFFRYHVMKEKELVLTEHKNMLILEAAHLEFLEREISSIEAEKERFQNVLVDYLRVVEQIEFVKLENELLQRKAKRLSKKTIEQSRFIREKNLKIDAQEAEILRCCNVVATRSNVMKKLEDDFRELQTIVNQLQEEKNELLIKLSAAENSASLATKIEAERVTMEDYNQLVNELEQLRKDRASEVTELIYLRWTNACLRHELMRIHENEEKIEEKKGHLELEHQASEDLRESELKKQACTDVATSSHHHQGCPKRKRLLHKLRRWVEGSSENMMKLKLEEKEKPEITCFGRLSVSEEIEKDYIIDARKSYSSA